ncbi:MAG: electron transfer flavoprotein subunit alpha/FixB family protein [Bacteroidetes bacterium]|nr:electron transfer flavoprotein subunit alpha/FixB family protein [Bacteroidota bacterium]
MSVLVFAENQNGKFKKPAFEAVTFGYKTAQAMGTECVALTLGSVEGAETLGLYGAAKVFNVPDASLNQLDSQVFAAVIAGAAEKTGSDVVIMSHTSTGKSILGRVAVRLNAGSVAGVSAIPQVDGSFKVKKGVFSSKAFAEYELTSANKVVSLMGNAIPPEVVGEEVSVETLDIPVPAGKVKVKEVKRIEGKVPLPEADRVVSGGRGLKGGENWGILDELAESIGATLACSRPVADADWRPHYEHVGQTGLAIRPNLYIAIGISGAIQHLAGVNNSKVIVVINKDPEAPFFKAADYGVVGDLFDVVPKLTAAIKEFKAAH